MLIIGAKGFAKEVLEILHQNNNTSKLCFYDDINTDVKDNLFSKFKIIKSEGVAKQHFETIDNQFIIGIGKPNLRKFIYEKFTSLGGTCASAISKFAEIGSFDVNIEEGCNILSGVKISNNVKIGKGCLIYYNAIITHDVEIGEFCEISPGAIILGNAKIGNQTHIASNSTILPKVSIGNNVIVAAGSVVTKNIPDNVMVAGIPAVIKKHI